MKNRLLLGVFIVFAVLSSCEEGEVYYRFHPIKSARWEKSTSVDFFLDSLAVTPDKRYDISLEIVNSNHYPYQNLWLYVQQNLTDTSFVTDTVGVKLTDAHGKWLGKGSAGLYQLSVPYKARIPIDSTRAYLIRVRHGMKDNSVKGIEKVGVLVKDPE